MDLFKTTAILLSIAAATALTACQQADVEKSASSPETSPTSATTPNGENTEKPDPLTRTEIDLAVKEQWVGYAHLRRNLICDAVGIMGWEALGDEVRANFERPAGITADDYWAAEKRIIREICGPHAVRPEAQASLDASLP